ncbi:MAG: hypothetical protein E7211_21470 [Clostridium lundense]|nr:hypothetical protein [Clostridium lundense]
MKEKNWRVLGFNIAVCGAVLVAIALTALLWPRGALTVMPRVESATWCEVTRNRTAGITDTTEPLTHEQMTALRAGLAETTLQWAGRRPGGISFGWDKPLYRLLLDDPGHFEMVDQHVYYDGWSYRLSEEDAQRLTNLLDSLLPDAT